MRCESAEEYAKHSKEGVTDFTRGGKCSGCGECCADYLPISEAEIATIQRYLRHHTIKENINRPPTASPTIDHTCPFRNNEKHKCEIYHIRPKICCVFQCNKSLFDISMQFYTDKTEYKVKSMRDLFFSKKKG